MKVAWLLLGLVALGNAHAQTLTSPISTSGLRDPVRLTNSLGLPMVIVPGCAALFCLWETRVTDYAAFVSATGRAWAKPEFAQTPLDPVVNVTWEDAAAFCQWLTAKERTTLGPKQRYRLPRDDEWSLAVGLAPETGKTPEEKMKDSIVWAWGYSWPPQRGDGNYGPELGIDSHEETAPVGSFRPNRHGLFDLGGNVWEWCEDWYNAAGVTKVLRGASFHDYQPKDLLAAYRFSATVHLSNDDIGFRIVLDSGER